MREDEAEISDVLIRYATGIDQRDWPLFRTCWTHDVDADYDQLGQLKGVDAITDVMIRMHEAMGPTYHQLSNFVINIDGDRAVVKSYVHAVLMLTPDDSKNWVDAVGHYDDVFIHTAEGWRIGRRVSRTARILTGGDMAAAAAADSRRKRQ
jgi:3-phenylpropionate/cinnamic acid dioxygenase small subunit